MDAPHVLPRPRLTQARQPLKRRCGSYTEDPWGLFHAQDQSRVDIRRPPGR